MAEKPDFRRGYYGLCPQIIVFDKGVTEKCQFKYFSDSKII